MSKCVALVLLVSTAGCTGGESDLGTSSNGNGGSTAGAAAGGSSGLGHAGGSTGGGGSPMAGGAGQTAGAGGSSVSNPGAGGIAGMTTGQGGSALAGQSGTGGTAAAGHVGKGGDSGVGGTDGAGGNGTGGTSGTGGANGNGGSLAQGGSAGSGGSATALGCGNGVREGDEACDGADLANATCASVVSPDATGTLGCSAYCMFDTGACSPSVACGDMTGTQKGAPWPTLWGCPSHPGRSALSGPTMSGIKALTSPSNEFTGPPVVAADGTIYIAGFHGLYAYSSTGEPVFHHVLTTSCGTQTTPAIGADGTVYFVSCDSVLAAISPAGETLWTADLGGEGQTGMSSPVLGGAGVYVFNAGAMHAFAFDGTVRWTIPFPGASNPTAAPAVKLDGTLLMASWGDQTNNLKAVTPAGDIVFERSIPSTNFAFVSPTVAADGEIYFNDGDTLTALRPDGSTRWTLPGVVNQQVTSSLLSADGTIHLVRDDGITAVHPDGTVAWSKTGLVQVQAAMVTGDGRIWASQRGNTPSFFALASDGSPDVSFPGAINNFSFPAMSASGAFVSTPIVVNQGAQLAYVGQ